MREAQLLKQENLTESLLWRSGEDGLESFYVYGLARTLNKVLLAFAEGRIRRRDQNPHHIVCKTSGDDGIHWSENFFVVRSANGETFSNPTPLISRKNGEIFLLYARNYHNEAADLFLTMSADNGKTWGKAKNLTGLFARHADRWMLHLPGPGHGLQTRGERLIAPVWHRRSLGGPSAERFYGVSIIYSDDDGATWLTGGVVPLGGAQLNESRIIELENGELLLNARSGAFIAAARFESRSRDQGLTWNAPQKIETLPDAFATDSSLVNLSAAGGATLIFIRPDDAAQRKKLTTYISNDDGVSWRVGRTLYAGYVGYSDAIILDNNLVGIIYGRDLLDEKGDAEGNVRHTVFVRFSLNRLGQKRGLKCQ